MRFIDRFTRDEFSAKVWWPFTMVLLVLFVLTFPAEHRAVDARHRETAVVDAALSQRVIQPNLESVPASTPITGTLSDALAEKVHDEIVVNDARIKAIRIWSSSHVLEWSSLSNDDVGSDGALNDDDIDAATAAAGAPTWLVAHRTPTNEPGPATFYSYTAIGAQPLHRVVRVSRWLPDLGRSSLVARLQDRDRARVAVGVRALAPFHARADGRDRDRGAVLRRVGAREPHVDGGRSRGGDRASGRSHQGADRIAPAQAGRERGRAAARGRSTAASPGGARADPGRRSVMPVPQSTAVKSDVVKIPEPSVVAPPESEAVAAAPRQARSWATRPLVGRPEEAEDTEADVRSGSRSRFRLRSPFRRRPSCKRREPEPVVRTPEPAPQRPVVETPQPEPAPIVPPPEPAPIVPPPDPIITPEPDPVEVAKVEPSDDGGSPEVVVVPELQPVGTPAGPGVGFGPARPAGGTRPRTRFHRGPPRSSRQAGANRRAQEAGIERASGSGRAAPILSSRVVGTARSGAGTTVSRQVLCDA